MSTIRVLRQEVAEQSKIGSTPLSPRLTAATVEALSDEFSRKTVSSSVLKAKTVDEICDEQGIPQSTCYRRIRHLVSEGVMVVERIVVTPAGKKHALYRSAFSRVDVRLENGTVINRCYHESRSCQQAAKHVASD